MRSNGILANRTVVVEWILRVGAFMCFVGHGAFGVMTKETWVRYFAVVGIGHDLAHTLMPVVGMIDIAMGCLMLISPIPVVVWWMLLWAGWTALLRPLAGEPIWEVFERGGNYGTPAAILILMSHSAGWKHLCKRGFRELTPEVEQRLRRALRVAVVFLLIGHGALGVLGKPGLVTNYTSVMTEQAAALVTPRMGLFEIILGVMAAFVTWPLLFLLIMIWKLVTEALFITAGAPVWEFIERGGSYCAPLALAVLAAQKERSDVAGRWRPSKSSGVSPLRDQQRAVGTPASSNNE